MKLLVTGDWHGDWYTAGVRRFEDVRNAAQTIMEAVRIECPDLFLFLGDLTDPDVGAFATNEMAIRFSHSLRGGTYQRWLVGNHDVVEDGYGTHAMLPLAAVTNVHAEPEAVRLKAGQPEIGSSKAIPETWLLCFPYVSTARAYDPLKQAEAFRKLVPKGSTVVVASHLMLEGIGPGSETQDMARGRDVFLPVNHLRDLFPGCTIFNGHYHTAQTFNGVHIPGSLIRLTKGEIGNVPGYLIANLP